jgi:hypothetical protein
MIVLWITTMFTLAVASLVVSFNNIVHSSSLPKSGSSSNIFVTVVVHGAGGEYPQSMLSDGGFVALETRVEVVAAVVKKSAVAVDWRVGLL